MITPDNFNTDYIDPIEQRQIDKFVCDEMKRQIHRYIKGMSGSKETMLRFEKGLESLSVPEREQAIARYIDLNRKAVSGLDIKMVLARAIANYCDTYSYMRHMLGNARHVVFYLQRIRDKYYQFHKVFEENGKFGIRDHNDRIIIPPLYDFLRTPYIYVDDMKTMPVIAQRDGKMGLILPDYHDTVVAPFVYDDISLRDTPPYFEARRDGKTYLLNTDGTCCEA